MHLVHASLVRRRPERPDPREAARVLDALWAHAIDHDRLEHARAHVHPDRTDLLLFLRQVPDEEPWHLAADLLTRCHRRAPHLAATYLPPGPDTSAEHPSSTNP
ncbi:hypothetical protein [Peterkaempfera sp. SMS 1(5)a]|uniref:hypothetical protein n=1 Tax=Peterkaempfera podocarpi TaxID=3232308 RepID=UPI00366FFAB0